ncbi:regulatory protein RecX [uncultured Microbacterium sp.]|uniref:regulatory protein RecX n=1 Tax=uncultured Microbacterium sp. TaxID=191216 RepID=UPI00262C59EC|nr:regulatory protein RecX [uncultured Microbacterium sp.]
MIPLFGGDRRGPSSAHPAHAANRSGRRGEAEADQWPSGLMDGSHRSGSVRAEPAPSKAGPEAGEPSAEDDSEQLRARAEEVLVRKLRGKQLSVSEARTVLRMTDVDREVAESIIDEFLHRGYLDDRTLAELLVTSGVERKGQGRIALSRSLAQRGIPRDIVDDVLGELPDDDAERALDYARGKASSMSGLEPDTALRRLLGQLARRGYGGSVAMNAARTALREAGSGRSGVRFVDSD